MQLDFAELFFEALEVLLNRLLEKLHVRGSHNDAGMDAGFLGAGDHAGEIEKEFGRAVGDESQIGIDALGHFFIEGDVDLLLAWFGLGCHK